MRHRPCPGLGRAVHWLVAPWRNDPRPPCAGPTDLGGLEVVGHAKSGCGWGRCPDGRRVPHAFGSSEEKSA